MKLFNTAFKICLNNLRKWLSNYRIWCIALILIILLHMFTKEIASFSDQMHIKVTPWIFPFLFKKKYIRLLFLFPLVLLFCDAPFIDKNQPYVIIRAGRVKWCVGQIFYIVSASAIFFAFILAASVIINLPHMQFDTQWGKIIGTLAKTDASEQMGLQLTIDAYTLEYFTPLSAMWFTFFLSWLTGIFLGLLIFAINCITANRIFGILSASAFLILDASLDYGGEAIRYSPVSWNNLSKINIDLFSDLPSIKYIYVAFAVLIFVLSIISVLAIRKKTIQSVPSI